RSEAIQTFPAAGLLRRYASRNDVDGLPSRSAQPNRFLSPSQLSTRLNAGRSAFDVDAAFGSLAMEPRASVRSAGGL
ncbi:MAG TPA: hypothetical protein VL996_13940, partial [Methylocella sp.]|nr:hypothetical protein [Methylocella sp.]